MQQPELTIEDIICIERARRFAIERHAGQVRKYTGEPYWTHPQAVVAIVSKVSRSPQLLSASWLHDVEEDCAVQPEELTALFGAEVSRLVTEVTDVSRPEDGPRAVRKALDRAHMARGSVEAKTLKLADVIDNVRTIVQHDRRFARKYLPEKRLLLDEALREGNAELWAEADRLVQDGLRLLEI